ncbi:MAG TPA: hypothetical protein PLN21_13580 [Gemmatales bacterium]|nr:hypothetical protein [Gemmatales bacterium]
MAKRSKPHQEVYEQRCKNCNRLIEFQENALGKLVKCRNCQEVNRMASLYEIELEEYESRKFQFVENAITVLVIVGGGLGVIIGTVLTIIILSKGFGGRIFALSILFGIVGAVIGGGIGFCFGKPLANLFVKRPKKHEKPAAGCPGGS